MGLSSKQVSGDWANNLMPQQQAAPPLKCPRCESTNTKFCYYNNYNRLQPRHFCKSCKRHWTKGGMLRNVPVGGGRKNKQRLKTSKNNAKSGRTGIQSQPQQIEFNDQKKFSEILYQSLLQPTPSLLPDYINSSLMNSTAPVDSLTPSFGYPFDANIQLPNVLDDTLTATMTTMPVQWQTPTNGAMDTLTDYWSWEDLHSMISTDERQPWDDSSVC